MDEAADSSIIATSPTKSRFVNRLTIQDLQAVQEAFFITKEHEEAELALDQEQFCELLSIVLSKGTNEDYCELFEKVDVSKEGFIDWDKLCSHLLLQYYEKDDRIKSTQVPQWQELKYMPCPHKDVINRFVAVGNPVRYYASASRDGTVAFWNLDLKLTRSFQVQTNPEEIKPRDLWVTHFIPLGHINKLAISLTSKEIAIYDLSSKTEFNCQYRIFGLHSTPICLDYWSDPNKSSRSILSVGDTGGNVYAIVFTNALIALFERPMQPAGTKKESCLLIDIDDIEKGSYNHAKLYKHSCHVEWVRKVQYLPLLDCFISCCTTNTNSMTLGWIEKGHLQMRTTCFNIQQGLNSFDFNPKANLIATAGINTQVCLWNPYVISKPVGILQGHMQSVIAVNFVQAKNQLISLSKEKVLRIWDTHLQVCLQRISGIFPKVVDAAMTMFFDQEKSKLFSSFNNQMTVLSMKAEITDKIISHEHPVTDAIYSKNFNQVVSVCAGSVITMWMLDTGQKVKQFTNAHGSSEISCLCQDPSGTRLLTGSTDGSIKIWDFNGQCHNILMASNGNPCEVSQILYLKSSIVTVGWDKAITCFPTSQLKTFYVYPVDWKGRLEHQDDILSTTFIPPRTLVTGGNDGDIVLWNTITEQAYRHLSAKKMPSVFKDKSHLQSRSRHSSPVVSARKHSGRGKMAQNHLFPGSSSALHSEDSVAGGASYSMCSILCLSSRANPLTTTGPANLVSATSGGTISFWNIHSSHIVGEFVAHEQTSSVTMATDEKNNYLVTGDSDGMCKVWSIETYCLSSSGDSVTAPPKLCKAFSPHSDSINSIIMLPRGDTNLILTSSSDCCLVLSTISGLQIGIFGQDYHWNIDKALVVEIDHNERNDALTKDDSSVEDSVQGEVKSRKASNAIESSATVSGNEVPAKVDEEFDIDSRLQTWNSTILGKSYQKRGNEKRERKQPYSMPFGNVERGQLSISAFQALDCKDLSDVPTLLKPDFVLHPERYFSSSSKAPSSEDIPVLPPIIESLQQRHDEKSLFPKTLLDDMRMKTASLAFASNSKYSKGPYQPITHRPSNFLPMLSASRQTRNSIDSTKASKDKKPNAWNKKILNKIASVLKSSDLESITDIDSTNEAKH